mmetsp:Transcript_20713/g.41731  ORF Transcript_20713/g.41731 Transcript_20713/m.41731 type:complete len:135 (+) Transcript_20713:94-498(+)|eukprot:CAMPEP_0196727920 /NCGR_PEP_ID=MMETSP1091-20130531/8778_1 /TAXON_ID=302021 /ORGANISM="Rhodomonas sp., Strain CCMP768" /LENGTH=134 /DNA_ID=CAMNT_0042070605 /DNA_START=87 /DNA_END=491 /DNA_ORIENTATION=+
MPTRAVCVLTGPHGVQGSITFAEDSQGTMVAGRLEGLQAPEVNLRVHQLGDVSSGAASCGNTYNPAAASDDRLPGDLGVYAVGKDGTVELANRDRSIPLTGQHNILGRALVVHSVNGNVSDSRVAWGVVGLAAE